MCSLRCSDAPVWLRPALTSCGRNLYGFEVDAGDLEKAIAYVRRESTRIERMAPEYFMAVCCPVL